MLTSVFGLNLQADRPIPGLQSIRGQGSRAVSVTFGAELGTDEAGRTRCVERRYPDGAVDWAADLHADGGYELSGQHCGRHHVSADGSRIHCAVTDADVHWLRLFLAQVLPLAAVLSGLETLHASAVVLGGRAMALTAPSGGGKSTIASALQARGAEFLTDDVLAIEPVADEIRAHCGPGLTWLVSEGGQGKAPREQVTYADDAPLQAIYLLGYPGALPHDDVQELPQPDPRLLLSLGFNNYVRSPRRSAHRLYVLSRMASSVRTFVVPRPRAASPAALAELLESHFAGLSRVAVP